MMSSATQLETAQVVHAIAAAVKNRGGRALLVGGSVRDELLGLPRKDYDLEIFGLDPAAIEPLVRQHGPVEEVGRAFGILKLRVGVSEIDVAAPRRESKVGPGHKGFAVATDPTMKPAEAARRRDFTINAIAKDPLTDELIDPFGGQKDLVDKTLRLVDERSFGDDPLRVLRAFQFAGRFGLNIENNTAAVLEQMVPAVAELPPDRLYAEWRKLFLLSPRPSLGLELARRVGYFDRFAPIIAKLKDTLQEPTFHPEGDVWAHTMLVVDDTKRLVDRSDLPDDERLMVMLTAFGHDVGKALTTRPIDGKIRSFGHAEAGVGVMADFLEHQGFPAHLVERVKPLIREHMMADILFAAEQRGPGPVKDGAVRRLINRLHPASLEQLLLVTEGDILGRGRLPDDRYAHPENIAALKNWWRGRVAKLKLQKGPVPIIQGRDLISLGWSPGPIFGRIIKAAEKLAEEKSYDREKILDLLRSADSPDQALERFPPP